MMEGQLGDNPSLPQDIISAATSQQQQPKHIRPKMRQPRPSASASSSAASPRKPSNNENDMAVEETRQRMESWMGLGKSMTAEELPPSSVVVPTAEILSELVPSGRPAGILKTPKYSKKGTSVSTAVASESGGLLSSYLPKEENDYDNEQVAVATAVSRRSAPVICKDVIVERDPSRPIAKRKPFRKPQPQTTIDDIVLAGKQHREEPPPEPNHASIEGYVPSIFANPPPETSATSAAAEVTTDSSCNSNIQDDDDNSNDDPLYIHSLAELMEAAGEKLPPPTAPIGPGDMVEANLEFSVMTQQDYDSKLSKIKQERDEDRHEQMRIFMGKPTLFPDSSDDEDDEVKMEDDTDVMEVLMVGEVPDEEKEDQIHYNDEDDNRPEPEAKPFRLLWQALTDWMTPHTVSWIRNLHASASNSQSNHVDTDNEWAPMVDRSDIGSSRCAGVMAMLKLYLTGCMEELHYPAEDRRRAEKRLTDILRTFDYSRENPKLHVSHWKAMTCILLEMVMANGEENSCENRSEGEMKVPPSVAVLGMSLEEYQYLSRKTIHTFDIK